MNWKEFKEHVRILRIKRSVENYSGGRILEKTRHEFIQFLD